MITGQAKMEFGTGDIRLTPMMENGVGALCCLTQVPTDYEKFLLFNDPEKGVINARKLTEVMMIFKNVESINTMIRQLNRVKNMMTPDKKLTEVVIMTNGTLNLDDFMKEEK